MALHKVRSIASVRCRRIVCRCLEPVGHGARTITQAISSRSSPASSVVLLLASFLGFLLLSRPLLGQVGPDAWFFEIDGDDGDWLEDTKGESDPAYLPALDVNLTDGSRSWGRRQMPCANWAPTIDAPYMGRQSYRVHCEGSGDQRRSEQMLLYVWYPNADDSQRYFSLAFRLVELPDAPPPETRGYIAQLHQGERGRHPSAFNGNICVHRIAPPADIT